MDLTKHKKQHRIMKEIQLLKELKYRLILKIQMIIVK